MQKGHRLEFACTSCKEPVKFSIFQLENDEHMLKCSHCQKQYVIGDETLVRQIKKFETLCYTIADSEEILGNTSVGVDLGDRHVKIPYKILLTRLSSCIELQLGDQKVAIFFRIEPSKDIPKEG